MECDDLHLDRDTTISLKKGGFIYQLPKTHKLFIDTSVVFYGASNTGKTTVIREFMYLLLDHIFQVVVFAPSNDQNQTYTGIVPPSLIKKTISAEHIESIFEMQEAKTEIYNSVNDVKVLDKIAKVHMCAVRGLSAEYSRIKSRAKDISTQYERYKESQMRKRRALKMIDDETVDVQCKMIDKQIKSAKKTCNDEIIKVYKSILHAHKNAIINSLAPEDADIALLLRMLYINPRLLMIFDDAIADVQSISKAGRSDKSGKKKESIFDTMFSRGRHAHVTIFISAQDAAKVNNTIKKNAFINVFTEHQCASYYFGLTSLSLKNIRDNANQVNDAIFSDRSNNNYKKMVYIRQGGNDLTFSYLIAKEYGSFRMCDDAIWKECEKQRVKDEHMRKLKLKKIAHMYMNGDKQHLLNPI